MNSYLIEIIEDDICLDAREDCVCLESNGGLVGTYDHEELDNRDSSNQHPISSITGLTEALASKQDVLTSGNGIDITDNVISNTGVTNMAVNASGCLTVWKGLQLV